MHEAFSVKRVVDFGSSLQITAQCASSGGLLYIGSSDGTVLSFRS